LGDLDDLHSFITRDLALIPITSIDAVLVGRAVKRPGQPAGSWMQRPGALRGQ
jgi:hypothetical protein